MDVVDLFTIMGNALDNAVESVEKRGKEEYKSIGVRVWKKDLFAVIQVENTFDGELKMKDGLPLTSKADKENHGIGMKIYVKHRRTLSKSFRQKILSFVPSLMRQRISSPPGK